MKRFTLALLTSAILATPAFAAEEPKPAPVPTAQVSLTSEDLNVIYVSLNKIAATCASDPDGCAVGMRKAGIQAKLEAAFKSLAPAPAKK